MYKITGLDIEITRGDTLALLYKFDGRELPYGTDAIFTIKKKPRDEEFIVQYRVDASDGTATIFLGSDDTNFDARTYYWDIRLQMPREEGGYEIQTPMEYAAFTIVEVIGGDIGSGDSEEVNPDLPVLQIVLEETKEVLARADTVVSSLEALNVEAQESSEPTAELVKSDEGLKLVLGLPKGEKGEPGELTPVTEADNGKVLTVVNGEWAAAELPKYNGTYEVTPLANEQTTLNTAQKFMDSDVTVRKIPVYEMSNQSGGNTVYIATEV